MKEALEIPTKIGRLTNSEILLGIPLPPLKILEALSENDYEDLTLEWAHYYLKSNYQKVYKIAGSGDKGRDVMAIVDEGKDIWDLYQCKHYQKQLAPTMVYVEIGKLCYYTYNKNYTVPRKYYFVAPKGIGGDLADLLKNQKRFKEQLISNWDKYCQKQIVQDGAILTKRLISHINGFDFSIFSWIEPTTFIEQFRSTPYFSRWFGGGLNKSRIEIPRASEAIQEKELVYISELFKAYSDHLSEKIKDQNDLKKDIMIFEHFNRQRDSFYIADSLNEFSREALPPGNNSFEELKDEIYNLVIEIVNKDYKDGYLRLIETTQEAKRAQFLNNALNYEMKTQDKEGVCHHLVNENRFKWVF